MPRLLSEDLSLRIIWLRILLGHTVKEVSQSLGISESSVERISATYLDTSDVKPLQIGRPIDSVSFTDDEQLVMMEAILKNPDQEFSEIAREISQVHGNLYAYSTIHSYLRRNGYKKKGESF